MSATIRRLAWSRLANPRVAVSLSATGLLLGILLGATSPNAETVPVRLPMSVLPSLAGDHLLASFMLYTSDILACLGLAGMLWAHSQGWRPNPRYLLLASASAVALLSCLSPVGSTDEASYAAYGNIAAHGGSPYTYTPASWGDPTYSHVVAAMWRNQPSVYGPFGTWIQRLAAMIGGQNPAITIWMLMAMNGLVFIGVGVLLLKTSDDPIRATLFWTANPVLILELVAGGHNDTYVAAMAIIAIQLARRFSSVWSDLLIGVLVGLACGVKIYAALIGLGLAWPLLLRRQWLRASYMTAAALITLALQYSLYGLSALKPLTGGLKWATLPSPWRVFELAGLAVGVPDRILTTMITVLWPVTLLVLAWLIFRRIASDQPSEVVTPFAVTFAWILSAPWVFAWYTAVPWVALTQVPRNRMTRWLTIVTVVLALCLSSGGGQATPVR